MNNFNFSICRHCDGSVDMKDTFRDTCCDCGEAADWNDNVEELAARVAAPCDDCGDDACDECHGTATAWNGSAYSSPAPDEGGRWETKGESTGYNWIPEYHATAATASMSQCYCSGNDSMCDDCHGTGAVRCG